MIGIINITGIQVAQRADDYFQPVNDFHEHTHTMVTALVGFQPIPQPIEGC